ncbi:hypothetical protein CFR71_11460 [Novacetimonas pomaceti]|uniref:Uncharacterized protein n=1 Tax=Novacetimonas pomaceti TaxID=2021998 RepID=A0A318QC80_9PROT|nr:hypothetical protein CFR71_11460 [Novacetimonas pomaceti]
MAAKAFPETSLQHAGCFMGGACTTRRAGSGTTTEISRPHPCNFPSRMHLGKREKHPPDGHENPA